jgi:hypothetical protein
MIICYVIVEDASLSRVCNAIHVPLFGLTGTVTQSVLALIAPKSAVPRYRYILYA